MTSHRTSRMIIFDDGLGQLGPMTDLRAAFEVRTGMLTTAGRIRVHRPKTLAGYWVPEPLRDLVGSRADAPVNVLPDEEMLYCVNGRWAVPETELELGDETAAVEAATGHVIAAHLRRATADYFLTTGQLHERVHTIRIEKRVLYKYPWDVLAMLPDVLAFDASNVRLIDGRVMEGVATVIGAHPVEVHARATVCPNVVLDAEQGPIVVHEEAVIRPGCVICGPCSIGAGATIIDRAHIKPNTVVGPVCKVGGEVGSTIFQGYANKAHDGHLGDSWVGKWVNLGAGTTNSNLLNTYGEISVRLEPDGPRHRTGMSFIGAVIGDHVKTAIGTRIMTGAVIGTGAMIATTLPAPRTVRRFAWLTDDGERTFRVDKFLQVARSMMERRGKTPTTPYEAAVQDLHRHRTAVPATPAE